MPYAYLVFPALLCQVQQKRTTKVYNSCPRWQIIGVDKRIKQSHAHTKKTTNQPNKKKNLIGRLEDKYNSEADVSHCSISKSTHVLKQTAEKLKAGYRI